MVVEDDRARRCPGPVEGGSREVNGRGRGGMTPDAVREIRMRVPCEPVGLETWSRVPD